MMWLKVAVITIAYRMIFLSCLSFLLIGCGQTMEEERVLDHIRKTRTLTVLTRNAPTTYYIGREGRQGFEHDLITAFASSLGVSVQFDVRASIASILDGIAKGEGDIAAAGLTRTPEREKTFLFGPDYHTVQQEVVCRRGGKRPADLQSLSNVSLLVIANSSYEERLRSLHIEMPTLHWQTTEDLPTEAILDQVWHRKVDCTIADSTIVAVNRRYYPELVVAFPLTNEQRLAWVLRPGGTDLQRALHHWFAEPEQGKLLQRLRERYYGHVDEFNYVDLKIFQRHLRERLPRFRPIFERAAQRYGFPWTLLAAQAYQESHWKPKARSPTGVRGIMMLTQSTARSLGVRNRSNPRQSILGGANYMAQLRKRIPEKVTGKNRWWFTLAAYNVGMGHLRDAMTLAKRQGKNAYVWREIKRTLPLLAHRKYFKTLTYGYARGMEPVRYVDRVRNYREMLEAHLKPVVAH